MRKSKRIQQSRQPKPQLGDGPVEKEYYDKMVLVSQAIDALFNGEDKGQARKVGFVLMVFPFEDVEGRCNYMSNGGNRKDIATLMKELATRFSSPPETSGKV